MANWHLEERIQISGDFRFPLLLMVGDNGIEVQMIFVRQKWFIGYRSADLYFTTSAIRNPPLEGEEMMVLGPHCTVGTLNWLSRALEPEDCGSVAANLKDILRGHLLLPEAVPPKVEGVRFLEPQLQPFDD